MKRFRIVNYIFASLIALCYFQQAGYLAEELSISHAGLALRGMSLNEGLPTLALIFLLSIPLNIYFQKQNRSSVFIFGYIAYICLVGLYFLFLAHFKYVVEYKAFGSWVYHVITCVVLFIWNAFFIYYLEKILK